MPPAVIVGAVTTAVTVAGYFLTKPKPPKIKPFLVGDSIERQPSPVRDLKQNIRSSVSPHTIIYGETVVAGEIKASFSSGTNKEYLHLIVVLAGHECNAITNIWLDDIAFNDSKFNGLVDVYTHFGASDQLADGNLMASIPEWTSNHRLRGITYLYIRLKWDANIWLRGVPTIKALVQGRKVYDPRTSITAYSNNATLCQLDYLISNIGINANLSEIDNASWIASANISDENIALVGGGTQKRYTCNGSFTLDKKPIDIMNELLTSNVGTIVYQQGKYYNHAGAWYTPTITLNENDLRGEISFQSKPNKSELYNAVKGTFIDSNNFYLKTDFSPRTNSTYETDDGGVRLYKDIDLPFTTNSTRSQRIAQIHLEQSRPGTLTYPCKLTAFELACMDTVYINNSILGWNNKTFRITDWALTEDYGIDLTLREDNASIWGWTSSSEQIITPPSAPSLPDPYTVTTPTGLTLLSGSTELLTLGDGTIVSRIKASWSLVPNQLVLSGGNYEIQYKKSTDSNWTTSGIVPGNVNFTYINGVIDGINYDVRVKTINSLGVSSSWATVSNHFVIGKLSQPSTPTGLTAVPYITSIGLSWNVNPDLDIAGYEIQRADDSGFTVNVLTISRPLSLTYVDDFLQQGITKFYRIRAINRSGVYSNYTTGVYTTTLGAGSLAIVDSAITEAKLATSAVTNTKIVDSAITEAKLATSAVTNTKIADNSISTPKIITNAVTSDKIVAQAIIADKIASNAIIADKIASNAVTSDKIVAQAIIADKIATNIINSSHLRTDTAVISTSVQIADALINNAHIQNLAVDSAKIGDLQVGTIKIANNAITTNVAISNDTWTLLPLGETVMDSLTLSTNGGEVAIWASASLAFAGANRFGAFRIRKDNITGFILDMKEFANPPLNNWFNYGLSMIGKDTSPNSSQTYVLTGFCDNGNIGLRRMVAINLKK